MTTISKTELAERLGISSPRVSQFVTSGLPVLADGKIQLETGLKWVSRNTLGPAGQRANELLREIEAGDDENNPVSVATNITVGVMFMTIPDIAQAAAIEAGAAPDLVEKIPALAHKIAMKKCDNVMTEMLDMSPRGDVWPDLNFCMKIARRADRWL